MKTLIVLICPFFFCCVSAQISSVGMTDEFKGITSIGRTQTESLQTYNSGNVKGSQFFNETWSMGSITSMNKAMISNNYLFLYDKVRQELFVKPKDSSIVVLIDKDQIFSFTINTDKSHLFYNAALFDSTQKGDFFELLVENEKYTLLKLIKTDFLKTNPNDLERVKQGDFQDEFVDHISYYIYANKKIVKVTLNENGIRKVFKTEKKKVDDFFSLHSNDEVDEGLLVNLINALN